MMIEHKCHTCGHEKKNSLCPHGSIEIRWRQDHAQECPFWIPEPDQTPHDKFVSEVERKCDECGM
jgi:hypothetical protein